MQAVRSMMSGGGGWRQVLGQMAGCVPRESVLSRADCLNTNAQIGDIAYLMQILHARDASCRCS